MLDVGHVQTFLDAKEVTERVITVVRNFEKVDPAKVRCHRGLASWKGVFSSRDCDALQRSRCVR
jgi:hypothetical protein